MRLFNRTMYRLTIPELIGWLVATVVLIVVWKLSPIWWVGFASSALVSLAIHVARIEES